MQALQSFAAPELVTWLSPKPCVPSLACRHPRGSVSHRAVGEAHGLPRVGHRCCFQPRPLRCALNAASHECPSHITDVPLVDRSLLATRARQLYEDAWSQGKILLLNKIMAEDHAQLDRIWQEKPGVGRQRMKRGILAYRKAYPDIV